jgi:hypothetical protein
MIKKFKNKLIVLIGGLLLCAFLSSFLQERETLTYTQKPTIILDLNKEQTQIFIYNDALNNDTLYLLKTQNNIPLNYFKNIKTGVCFDKECRPLKITVYWNITGRYLGFELQKGEFLSKHDHEPFSEIEYNRLNELMADSSLPFASISFENLIDIPESETDEVDAISGATTENVAKIVVKGAAYTTYKLWNIIYGPTMDLVSQLTEKQLRPDLINMILKSPDISDRIWGLDRIDPTIELNPELTSSLLDFISGDDFYLAYNALDAIDAVHLNSAILQLGLYSIYTETNPSIKNGIVKKLMEAPFLSPEIVTSSRALLEDLNGQQLGEFLKLYSKYSINDVETCREISKILENENRYISQKAYQFLLVIKTNDSLIGESIKKYETK